MQSIAYYITAPSSTALQSILTGVHKFYDGVGEWLDGERHARFMRGLFWKIVYELTHCSAEHDRLA